MNHMARQSMLARVPRLHSGLWYLALAVSLVGAIHWIAAAFGVDSLRTWLGSEPELVRAVYLGVALAALYAIYGVLQAARRA